MNSPIRVSFSLTEGDSFTRPVTPQRPSGTSQLFGPIQPQTQCSRQEINLEKAWRWTGCEKEEMTQAEKGRLRTIKAKARQRTRKVKAKVSKKKKTKVIQESKGGEGKGEGPRPLASRDTLHPQVPNRHEHLLASCSRGGYRGIENGGDHKAATFIVKDGLEPGKPRHPTINHPSSSCSPGGQQPLSSTRNRPPTTTSITTSLPSANSLRKHRWHPPPSSRLPP